jgi:hypothetical protein
MSTARQSGKQNPFNHKGHKGHGRRKIESRNSLWFGTNLIVSNTDDSEQEQRTTISKLAHRYSWIVADRHRLESCGFQFVFSRVDSQFKVSL